MKKSLIALTAITLLSISTAQAKLTTKNNNLNFQCKGGGCTLKCNNSSKVESVKIPKIVSGKIMSKAGGITIYELNIKNNKNHVVIISPNNPVCHLSNLK